MDSKRRFTKEYKEEIIKLVAEQGKKVTHVARDIGVSESTVRGWIRRYKEHGKNAFPGIGNLRPDDEKIRRLKKRVGDIEEENAISKKSYMHFHKAREIHYQFICDNCSIFRVGKMYEVFYINRAATMLG